MNDPRVVANYMLDFAASRGIELSNLALQKLLFFAHSISLVERKAKLVQGYFEAWRYGPVHPTVYQAFKDSGSSPIKFRAQSFNPVTRERQPLLPLSDPAAQGICERVIVQFGSVSAGQLVDITHAAGGPWARVVAASANGANIGLRISDEIIVQSHGRQKVTVSNEPRVGEPSEDFPLVSGGN